MKVNNEKRWQIASPETYKSCAKKIEALKKAVPDLKQRYAFSSDYDLEDALVGAYGRYMGDSAKRHLQKAVGKHTEALQKIAKSGSLDDASSAEHVALALFMEKVPSEGTHWNRRVAARKILRHDKHLDGRKTRVSQAYSENMLVKSLGIIYGRGTNKLPAIGRRSQRTKDGIKRSSPYRGRYYRFVIECVSLMKIKISNHKIRTYGLEARDYLMTHKSA